MSRRKKDVSAHLSERERLKKIAQEIVAIEGDEDAWRTEL